MNPFNPFFNDDDDEEEGNSDHVFLSILFMAYSVQVYGRRRARRRKKMVVPKRMDWDKDFQSRTNEMCERALRMSMESFSTLVEILHPALVRDVIKGNSRGGIIEPRVRLLIFLRMVAGASYLDLHFITGASRTTIYNIFQQVEDAINRSTDPRIDNIRFPLTEEECKRHAKAFQHISVGDAIVNCVSVLDGFLMKITTPSKKQVGNQKSYFSGHYACYGLNVQAACDAECRFTYLEVVGPGVLPDREAYKLSALAELVENLPPGYVVIGDPAYTPTEHMIPIFFGESAKRKRNDTFNYFASQCRIRIEMAFGLMTRKFGILQRPYSGRRLRRTKTLMKAIARLHNFVIDERLAKRDNIDDSPDNIHFHQPSTVHNASGLPIDYERSDTILSALSIMRLQMVERISQKPHLSRPKHSVLHNRNNKKY